MRKKRFPIVSKRVRKIISKTLLCVASQLVREGEIKGLHTISRFDPENFTLSKNTTDDALPLIFESLKSFQRTFSNIHNFSIFVAYLWSNFPFKVCGELLIFQWGTGILKRIRFEWRSNILRGKSCLWTLFLQGSYPVNVSWIKETCKLTETFFLKIKRVKFENKIEHWY